VPLDVVGPHEGDQPQAALRGAGIDRVQVATATRDHLELHRPYGSPDGPVQPYGRVGGPDRPPIAPDPEPIGPEVESGARPDLEQADAAQTRTRHGIEQPDHERCRTPHLVGLGDDVEGAPQLGHMRRDDLAGDLPGTLRAGPPAERPVVRRQCGRAPLEHDPEEPAQQPQVHDRLRRGLLPPREHVTDRPAGLPVTRNAPDQDRVERRTQTLELDRPLPQPGHRGGGHPATLAPAAAAPPVSGQPSAASRSRIARASSMRGPRQSTS
jgi:hypothetical protein